MAGKTRKRNGNSRQAMPDRHETTARPKAMRPNWASALRRSRKRCGKFHDLIARIDETLADPAAFTKNPAKAALLSASAANSSGCSRLPKKNG